MTVGGCVEALLHLSLPRRKHVKHELPRRGGKYSNTIRRKKASQRGDNARILDRRRHQRQTSESELPWCSLIGGGFGYKEEKLQSGASCTATAASRGADGYSRITGLRSPKTTWRVEPLSTLQSRRVCPSFSWLPPKISR